MKLQNFDGYLQEKIKVYRYGLQANVLRDLKQFVHCSNDDLGQENNASTPGPGNTSPLLKPLSPPPTDAEILQLEHSVNEASARLLNLRKTMQVRLQEQLACKLAECRPNADPGPPLQAENASMPDQLPAGTTPEDMQHRLATAAARLPSLRARLEEANSRLHRVAAVVSSDIHRAAANSVEKSLLGKTPTAAAEPDPAILTALETGQVSTRRKTGYFKPIPIADLETIAAEYPKEDDVCKSST